ncbi:MAG: hypothetical protein ACLGJB_19630 [Blastocatellia bacterium]
MIDRRHRALPFMLLLVLVAGLGPKCARAEDGSQQKPLRLYAMAAFGPIGMVYSSGAIAINNRRAQSPQAIWDGDMVEALAGAEATVSLDGVGGMTLTNGAAVTLATRVMGSDAGGAGHVLVASVAKGDMLVRLDGAAGAYIEASGSACTAARGASFCVAVREGKALIDGAVGAVTIEPQRRVATIKARGARGLPPLPPGANEQVNLRTKKRAELKALFEKIYGPSTTRLVSYALAAPDYSGGIQPAQDREKLANRLVRFEVTPPDIGRVIDPASGLPTDSAMTDADGVVTVFFQAGDKAGAGQVVAEVELTPAERADMETLTTAEKYTWDVTVTKAGIFTTRNKILVGAAAVAVIVVACCAVPGGTRPLQQQPPPVIRP